MNNSQILNYALLCAAHDVNFDINNCLIAPLDATDEDYAEHNSTFKSAFEGRGLAIVPVRDENEQLDFLFVFKPAETTLVHTNLVANQNCPGSDPVRVLSPKQIDRLVAALQQYDGQWHLSGHSDYYYYLRK